MSTKFKDREDAAQQLARLLTSYENTSAVVLGIPRGGIVTAHVIAQTLGLPLGLVVVRKIGHPDNEEFAIAAITESGQIIKDQRETQGLDPTWFAQAAQKQLVEAGRRRQKYWGNRSPLDLKGQTVIIVDDGLATGLTMEAAIQEVKRCQPAKIVVAVPVAPRDTAERLRSQVDQLITVDQPRFYEGAVGNYYETFPQVEDAEVSRFLA